MGSAPSRLHKRSQSSQLDISSLYTPVLTLQLRRFEWIDGGDYRPDAVSVYSTPRGENEEWGFNVLHHIIRFVFQGNYMTPIEKDLQRGIRVLDAGCGTGIWSIEMARKYPNSEFVGTDLVDVVKGSPGNERLQCRSFREVEWPTFLGELIRVTKPGGWVELVDMDGWLHGGPWVTALYAQTRMMSKSRGIDTEFIHRLPEFLQARGLVDIKQSHRLVPVGWGPEEISTLSAKIAEVGLKGLMPVIVKETKMGEQEYDEMVNNALIEFTLYQAYWNAYYAYGRKPITTNCDEY